MMWEDKSAMVCDTSDCYDYYFGNFIIFIILEYYYIVILEKWIGRIYMFNYIV